MAAELLEKLLLQILSGDNAHIYEISRQISKAIDTQEGVSALCSLLRHQNDGIRQYACILLRKCVAKEEKWHSMHCDIKSILRKDTIQLVCTENTKPVKKSLVALIGSIARFGVNEHDWPELMNFFHEACSNSAANIRELGMWVLSLVADYATDSLLPLMPTLISLCNERLKDAEPGILFYTIKQKKFRALIPEIIRVINKLIETDETMALESLEVFDDLFEYEVPIIQPFIGSIFELLFGIMNNQSLDESLRARAATYLSWIVKRKKKLVVKQKLMDSLLDAAMKIMGEVDPDDDDDENVLPRETAVLVLSMCNNLPSNQLMPAILERVEPMLASEDPIQRRTALITLALAVEGNSEYVRKRHLQSLMRVTSQAVNDTVQSVKNGAMFMLGQMCLCLQPDISNHASDIIPFLLSLIDPQKISGKLTSDSLRAHSKVFYAIETFCENMSQQKFSPYVESVTNTLLSVLQIPSLSDSVRTYVFSSLGAVSATAGKNLAPFVEKILHYLQSYFAPSVRSEEQIRSQAQAIETLSLIVRNVLGEDDRAIIEQSARIAFEIESTASDPDQRRAIHGLWASIAKCLKTSFPVGYLERVVQSMIIALNSQEGMNRPGKGMENTMSSLADLEKEIETMEEDYDDDELTDVENPYLDEKEDACINLADIAESTGPLFAPYLEKSFKIIRDLTKSNHMFVQKAAIESISKLAVAASKLGGDESSQNAVRVLCMEVVTCLTETINNQKEKTLVTTALSSYAYLIKNAGQILVGDQRITDTSLNLVRNVLRVKLPCQVIDLETEDDEEEEEDDELLLETAGEILPALAEHLDVDTFLSYFASLSTLFDKYMKSQNMNEEKAFAIGCIAESIETLGRKLEREGKTSANLEKLVLAAKDSFLSSASDNDTDVRNNAIYGLGLLVLYGNLGPAINQEIYSTLSSLLQNESNPRCKDQIVAALARVASKIGDCLPLDSVIKTIVSSLPLEDDPVENNTCVICLARICQRANSVLPHFEELAPVLPTFFENEDMNEEGKAAVIFLLNAMGKNNPTILESLHQQFPRLRKHLN
ncbi:DgyrCDS12172 [Dimorphilus gyrociliatus]|uniref:DgyrCDS12172 n=1 Tax=Dimorphilus gyrociliatus TaxID=2664684 RepID=A0A7I8W6Q2_9ANNE|nr:DgyrCDS12172 [Dimorphilus gyrociliatus]